jgi:hypothetical protein
MAQASTGGAAIETACSAQPDANLAATLEGVITAK